jgi:heme exporter protein D
VALAVGLGLGALAMYVANTYRNGTSWQDGVATAEDREQRARAAEPKDDRMQDFVADMVLRNRDQAGSEDTVRPAAVEPNVGSPAPSTVENTSERSLVDEARERETRELRSALPDNMHLPGKRSKAELQQQMADIQEQQQLLSAISSGKASVAEHQRYYELQAKRFQDEIELADHCEKTVAGMGETARNSQHPFCAEVASRGKGTRESNEAALAALRQELHLDAAQR